MATQFVAQGKTIRGRFQRDGHGDDLGFFQMLVNHVYNLGLVAASFSGKAACGVKVAGKNKAANLRGGLKAKI
ncbi:MAG: hypothetical protein BroJett015_00580 [Chloroflexota bacterium]|nr:MAG: hypothetical protein BroJett015_00580 [Chloroflexota bacterium]